MAQRRPIAYHVAASRNHINTRHTPNHKTGTLKYVSNQLGTTTFAMQDCKIVRLYGFQLHQSPVRASCHNINTVASPLSRIRGCRPPAPRDERRETRDERRETRNERPFASRFIGPCLTALSKNPKSRLHAWSSDAAEEPCLVAPRDRLGPSVATGVLGSDGAFCYYAV